MIKYIIACAAYEAVLGRSDAPMFAEARIEINICA